MTLRTRTLYMVAHTTATLFGQDIGAAEVDRMHKAKGWSGTGYAAVIRLNGKEEIGRGYDAIGAHVEGFNSVSFGVAYVGGLGPDRKPANTLNPAQEETLHRIFEREAKRYPKAGVCGHRDLSPDRDGDGVIEPAEWLKACPCFDAIPWAISRGLPAANIRGVWNDNAPRVQTAPDARQVYLQKLLLRAGYVFGPVDGIVGERTAKAIREFQLWSGLTVTGEFDRATVAVLRARFEKAAA